MKTRIRYDSKVVDGELIERYTAEYAIAGLIPFLPVWCDLEERFDSFTTMHIICNQRGVKFGTLEYCKALIDYALEREAKNKAVKASRVTKYIGYP